MIHLNWVKIRITFERFGFDSNFRKLDWECKKNTTKKQLKLERILGLPKNWEEFWVSIGDQILFLILNNQFQEWFWEAVVGDASQISFSMIVEVQGAMLFINQLDIRNTFSVNIIKSQLNKSIVKNIFYRKRHLFNLILHIWSL